MANEHKFKDTGVGIKHGQLAISVKFPSLIDERLRNLPEKSKTIRGWVIERMLEEGLISEEEYQQATGVQSELVKKRAKRKAKQE